MKRPARTSDCRGGLETGLVRRSNGFACQTKGGVRVTEVPHWRFRKQLQSPFSHIASTALSDAYCALVIRLRAVLSLPKALGFAVFRRHEIEHHAVAFGERKHRAIVRRRYREHPGEFLAQRPRGFELERVPAAEILHLFVRQRPGQVPLLLSFSNLTVPSASGRAWGARWYRTSGARRGGKRVPQCRTTANDCGRSGVSPSA